LWKTRVYLWRVTLTGRGCAGGKLWNGSSGARGAGILGGVGGSWIIGHADAFASLLVMGAAGAGPHLGAPQAAKIQPRDPPR